MEDSCLQSQKTCKELVNFLNEKKEQYRLLENKWSCWLSRCSKKDRTNRQRIWEDIDEEKTQFKRLMLSELRDRGFMESDAAQLYEKQFQETVNSTTPRTATEDNPSFYRTVKKRNIVKLAIPAVDSPKVVMSRGEEEWKRITELLCSKDLKIYEVVADGDCLFRAFAHQLERCTGEKYSVLQLRQLVASTIWKEKDRYLPFLTEEEGVAYHENIERYCSDLEERKLWGGELELKVLSEIFSVPIQVFLDGAAPWEIYPEKMTNSQVMIRLSFHRYLYSLGPHYNSVI